MSEDYTYEPTPTLAEAQATIARMQERVALLEAQLNAAVVWMAAVPVDAIRTLYNGMPGVGFIDIPPILDAIGDWLHDMAPLPDDDEVQP